MSLTLPPDRPPRIALAGFGGWGPNLARVLARLDCLAAIYDASPDARSKAMAAHPQVPYHADWQPRAALYDAVVVATPAQTHLALAQEALRVGLDVFVEKPLALTPADAQALADAADAAQRVLMVGHLLVYHPAVQAMARAIHSRALGSLRQLVAERHNFGIIRSTEDVIFSLGPHDVAAMLYLTGQTPTHVAAFGQRLLGTPRLDACQMQLHFPGEVLGRISLSWLHPVKAQRLIVQGTEAAMVLDDVDKHLSFRPMALASDAQGAPLAVRVAHTRVDYAATEPLEAEVRAFIAAIQTRQPAETHGQHGADVVRVLTAAQRSVGQGGCAVALT